ncbi:hypothetical protein E2C01_059617 [Portunus trituberculatus]|uniref:Uncharacterized protein n=1 Tax=Portunus trituberculatus TaxID=210409 RepID=A0A5B7H325_PORTR|nr:hypothetical protein [Portunus trituberculatus]
MVSRKLKFARQFPTCQLFPTARIPLTLATRQAGSLFTYAWLPWLPSALLHLQLVVVCLREQGRHTLEERLEVLDRAEKGQRNSVIQAALCMNEATVSLVVVAAVVVMVMVVVMVIDARTPLSLALEGEAVQPRDEVDMLGVTLMRIAWLLDGKGLGVLYKAQVRSFIL